MLRGTGDYVDIREMLPGYHFRECPACGAEWWEQESHHDCPECGGEEVLCEFAEKWETFSSDDVDYGIKPEPWYYPILHGMAREATDRLGYDVNIFHYKDYILAELPEEHPDHATVEERREMYAA